MAFKARDPVRIQIVINNNIIEKINTLNYPGCLISYQNEKAVTVKVSIILQITGIKSITSESSQVQKQTRLTIYNTSALATILYGRETQAVREQDKSRIKSGETKLMRRRTNYKWQDYKTNEDILSEFRFNAVVKRIQNYRK
jgi:competence transcription factor ComK